jgi:hypothetical protein
VLTAQRRHDEARQRLHSAVADAVEAGVPQTTLADALSVTRVIVWRSLRDMAVRSPRDAATSGGMTHQEDDPDEHRAA